MSNPFPVGLVPSYIKPVEETVSRNGNEMLVITFLSYEGLASIKYYLVDDKEFAPRKLKSLEKAFNIPFGSRKEGFTGKKGVVRTELDYFNGYKIAKVVGFAPYDPAVKYESRLPSSIDDKTPPPSANTDPRYSDIIPF
ncbi:MAG: hypothetical protein LBP19_05185 [Treponema sp.]|jgi:hypothetical protein|nr:hypothetical protein [Treponema sp.]